MKPHPTHINPKAKEVSKCKINQKLSKININGWPPACICSGCSISSNAGCSCCSSGSTTVSPQESRRCLFTHRGAILVAVFYRFSGHWRSRDGSRGFDNGEVLGGFELRERENRGSAKIGGEWEGFWVCKLRE